MSKWTQPPGQVTKQPIKVRILGVEPRSELAASLVGRFATQINHFHLSQVQKQSIGGLPVYGAHIELPHLRMRYTNQFGNEMLQIEIAPPIIAEEIEKLKFHPPERDIELGGYIALHNANVSTSDEESNAESELQWGLKVNDFDLGAHPMPQGSAIVYTFGNYKLNFHSWHTADNPNGTIGVPSPPYPGGEIGSRKYYPMYGFDPSQPAFAEILPGELDDEFEFTYGAPAAVTVVECSLDVLNLFNDNDVFAYEVSDHPDDESPAYGWIYAEFFNRCAREVNVSWRFPFAQNQGVPRRILTNDDPLFWWSVIGGAPAEHDGLFIVGSIDLDLSPPFFMRGSNDSGIPNLADVYPASKRAFNAFGPTGFNISLFEPWP